MISSPTLQQALTIPELPRRIVALEQLAAEYPEEVELLYHLGDSYARSGATGEAVRVLSQAAERLRGSDRTGCDESISSRVFLTLSQLYGDDGEHAAAVSELAYAHEYMPEDRKIASAYALMLLRCDRTAEACSVYDHLWESDSEALSASDLLHSCRALRAKGNHAAVVERVSYLEARHGLSYSAGLLSSPSYEALGRYIESYLAAVQDMDWSRLTGSITDQQVAENQQRMQAAARDLVDEANQDMLEAVLAGVDRYFSGSFAAGAECVSGANGVDLLYWRYLTQVCNLRGTPADVEVRRRYLELEPLFSRFPGYYYHLWHALRDGDPSYCFRTAQQLLEKTIAITGSSTYGTRTKEELCRLVGLDASCAERLLTAHEMEQLVTTTGSEVNERAADAVLDCLDLPATVYTPHAVQAVWEMCSHPAYVGYFRTRSTHYSPDTQRILAGILPTIP
ncbi:hypothetical protein SAMN05920897_11954 [Alkalispirochaeta americana]|uniref:Tetratricopeptide repeat-containing protein n=1 Tax=Alkalispirochaeta americana TaxID=159291 RepID=A0A1N6WZS7_9SPIO|nr:hypothetical protein [Alkalispirochaeta americana]SIQ95592.1 hypothetical protein SAMN05920897_11954 [Alkalispirochaeta americana]